MAFDVTFIIQAIDKFSQTARNIAKSTAEVTKKFEKLSETAEKFQSISRGIFRKVALPVVGLGAALFHTAAQFQTMNIGFRTMIGNKKKAEELFKSLTALSQRFGAATTLELGRAAGSFLAVKGQAEQIPGVLSRLTDITSGTSLTVEALARNYAAIFAGDKVQRIFMRGLMKTTPIISVLGGILKKTTAETMKAIAAGQVHFKTYRKAIIIMTSKGGTFFKMQEQGAHSIAGSFRMVRDSLQVLSAVTGEYVAKQIHLTHAAFKFRDIVMKIEKNFDSYIEKYGTLIKVIGFAIAGFLAMMVTTFILGTAIRFVGNIIKIAASTMWFLRKAAIALRITLISLKIIVALFRGTIILTELAMAPLLLAIILIVGAVVLLAWGFKKLFQWLKGAGAFTWLSNKAKQVFHAMSAAAQEHFPLLTKIIKASMQWIVKSFDWLLSKGNAIKKFFNSIGEGLKKMFPAFGALDATGTLTTKMLGPTGLATKMLGPTGLATTKLLGPVMPMGTVPLTSPGGGVDALTAALSAAFPALSEGLEANINIGITSKSDLQIDRMTHSSSSPNVDVGTTMPLAAHGAV